MKINWYITLPIGVAVVFGGIIGLNILKQQLVEDYIANMKENVNPVVTQKLTLSEITPFIKAVGFIEPSNGVDVTSSTSGKIVSINFENSSHVKKGELLVKLEDDVERAALEVAKSKYDEAQKNYERYQKLAQQGGASIQQLDSAKTNYYSLIAEIKQIEAQINRLNIKAPFDGVLGLKEINLGQFLKPGDKIVHLEDNSNMKIKFSINQNQMEHNIAIGTKVLISVDQIKDHVFEGTIIGQDTIYDKNSGNIKFEASIPNDNGKLISGMYATVKILLPKEDKKIIIPQTAITYNLYGTSVYIVSNRTDKNGNIVKNTDDGQPIKISKQVPVTLGRNFDDKIEVIAGLNGDEELITEGLIRLNNNSAIKVTEQDKLNGMSSLPKL